MPRRPLVPGAEEACLTGSWVHWLAKSQFPADLPRNLDFVLTKEPASDHLCNLYHKPDGLQPSKEKPGIAR